MRHTCVWIDKPHKRSCASVSLTSCSINTTFYFDCCSWSLSVSSGGDADSDSKSVACPLGVIPIFVIWYNKCYDPASIVLETRKCVRAYQPAVTPHYIYTRATWAGRDMWRHALTWCCQTSTSVWKTIRHHGWDMATSWWCSSGSWGVGVAMTVDSILTHLFQAPKIVHYSIAIATAKV